MKSIMSDMFSELTNLLKQKIDNSWAISLTTDSCTSRATASYTTITAHVMDTDFQLESFVLQNRQVTVSHTTENLSEELKLAIDERNLKRFGDIAITTDNAANIVNAVKLTGMKHSRCLAHVLNLCVKRCAELCGIFTKAVRLQQD